MKLKINNKEFIVKKVTSEEDMRKGLQGVKELPEDEGMLFEFPKEQTVTFWMKDTLIDLDIIFIDEDKEVISLVHGKAGNDDEEYEEDEVKWVLEINPNVVKIKPGMEVEFYEDEIKEDKKEPKIMHVLDSEGETQMVLKGGERIFSRKNTKTLVRLAKRADSSKLDSDYKRLGNKIFAYLNIQENNDPDYVEAPKTKKED